MHLLFIIFWLNSKVSLKTHIYLDGLTSGRISKTEGFETSLSILNTHKPTIHSNSTYFLTVTLTQHIRVTCETFFYLILCNAVCSFSSLSLALPLIWFIVITDTPIQMSAWHKFGTLNPSSDQILNSYTNVNLVLLDRVVCVVVAQSCPTLGDPKDCSPPGSSVEFSRQEYWRR